jgi:hypothetical protein
MMQPAVRFSPDVETPALDEAQVIRDLSDTLHDIMETTSRDYGHAVRAVPTSTAARSMNPPATRP